METSKLVNTHYHLCCYYCQEGGQIFLSIDANFGLCRTRAAGTSVREPLHHDGFFTDQKEIDAFVGAYGTPKLSLQKVECGDSLK